jgi:hypothetical protein
MIIAAWLSKLTSNKVLTQFITICDYNLKLNCSFSDAVMFGKKEIIIIYKIILFNNNNINLYNNNIKLFILII